MTNTVLFIVGGIQYKVSRSLLEMHPNTMLARSASEQCLHSHDPVVSIEHEGICFGLVLDYLRDNGHVNLPITVPKPSFVADLVYYGVENIDESKIIRYHDAASRCLADVERRVGERFRDHIRLWYDCRTIFLLTKECAAGYMASGGKFQFEIYGPVIDCLEQEDKILCSSDAFMAIVSLLEESSGRICFFKEKINGHLAKFGIKVTSLYFEPDKNLIEVSMKPIYI